MLPGNRALAFASRWFDPATVRRTFEPLIADWQREWRDSAPSRRRWIWIRGWVTFVTASIVVFPGVALRTSAPAEVTRSLATRVTRFVGAATAVLMIPPAISYFNSWMAGASWMRVSLFLFAIPAALVLAFPFAMAAAVDAIRGHNGLAAHVERVAVLKFAAFAVAFMAFFGGWVVPAASRASRVAMNPPGMTAPLRGMRELTTFELIVDPARATVFAPGTYLASRSTSLRRELNSRAMLITLPAVLLWTRWRSLNQPRLHRMAPLPGAAAAVLAAATMFAGGATGSWLEREHYAAAGVTYWLPIAAFITWAIVAARFRSSLRPRTSF